MKQLTALLIALCLLLCGCAEDPVAQTQPADTAALTENTLTVHFIDVGQADCALLECGGEYLLIDGGNQDDGELVADYLDALGVEVLNTVIATHVHEDHMGGLLTVLEAYPTQTVLSTTNNHDSYLFNEFLSRAQWQGIEIAIPKPGDRFSLGDAEITVLGPVTSYTELNDTSIVCRVDHGESSFLFTGDMEMIAEEDMLDHWNDKIDWDVDVLKVGHHGSYSSTGFPLLDALSPEYAVIPCGENNDYGYPHDEPMFRLEHTGCEIYRTDEMGTIVEVSDGQEIRFTWEKEEAQPFRGEPGETGKGFIGNRNSMAFHAPYCDGLPSERNRVAFSTYAEAEDAGYYPCGNCLGSHE